MTSDASLLRILASVKHHFLVRSGARPENDKGSGLQPLLAPHMSPLRIIHEGTAVPSSIPGGFWRIKSIVLKPEGVGSSVF